MLSALLIILGAVLLAAGIFFPMHSGPDLADLHRSGVPLIDLPVTGLATHQLLKLRIPDDPMWKRMERELGQPEYLVGGVGSWNSTNHLLCAKAIRLTVTVSSGGHPIPLRNGRIPYAYSAECADVGFDFSARAGEHVDIEISTRTDQPAAFDLEVMPVWPTEIKDFYVGALPDENFTLLCNAVAAVGALLLAAGITIILIRRKRSRRLRRTPAAS